MSGQVRDLRCRRCDRIYEDQVTPYKRYGRCPSCGGSLEATWERGKPPTTDLYGTPRYSDATGRLHASHREKVQHMRSLGYHEAGDPVGGARVTLSLRGTAFSYAGQGRRVSTAERIQARGKTPPIRAATPSNQRSFGTVEQREPAVRSQDGPRSVSRYEE